MKQCKVCGTLVHIDSNTCPSCGNHSFFVLDVKICPLCGKVNNITNSYCEQCGKQFVTAKGKTPFKTVQNRPVNTVYKEKPQFKNNSYINNSTEQEYEIEKPVVKISKPLKVEENAAERAYKDFIALKPEVVEKEDHSEYSYFVKGDPNKLPVIILPKFAKTQGKNILVNIVVNNNNENSNNNNYNNNVIETKKPEIYNDDTEEPSTIITEEIENKSYTPFSAINKQDNITENKEDYEKTYNEEKEFTDYSQEKDVTTKTKTKIEPEKNIKNKKIKKVKSKPSGKSIFYSILFILTSLGVLASLFMVFYASDTPEYRTAGISPVIYVIKNLFKTDVVLPIPFDNGFTAYYNNYHSGQFAHLANIVPYLFTAVAVFALVNFFILLFTFKCKRWAKTYLIITNTLSLLCIAAITLAIKYVFNSGGFKTLGLGLITAGIIVFINFLFSIFAYKPAKKIVK